MAGSPFRIRCSNLDRIASCPGALQMEEKFPELEDSESALEGTAAHECFAMEYEGVPFTTASRSSDGVAITEEMLEAGAEFVDIIRSWNAPYVYIEQQLPASRIHPLCGGTPDAWGWDPATYTIYLADLKFGHRDVEVLDNSQLTGYTQAIAEVLKIDGHTEQFITLDWTIFQPRCYRGGGTRKHWRGRLSDIRQQTNKIVMAVQDALGATPSCHPGPHCRDCLGRHACVALQRAGASVTDFAASTLEEFTLNDDQCGKELRRLLAARETLDARIEGLSEQAISSITRGGRVTGFELKRTSGRETWRPETAGTVAELAKLYNIDVLRKPELITPNQARQLGFDVDSLNLSHKPGSGVKLVPISTIETKKIFGANKNG